MNLSTRHPCALNGDAYPGAVDLACLDSASKKSIESRGLLEISVINSHPTLADLDPDGLGDRLRSLRYEIDETMIERTRTEAGSKALIALHQANAKQ